jgi:hypothetical protein
MFIGGMLAECRESAYGGVAGWAPVCETVLVVHFVLVPVSRRRVTEWPRAVFAWVWLGITATGKLDESHASANELLTGYVHESSAEQLARMSKSIMDAYMTWRRGPFSDFDTC